MKAFLTICSILCSLGLQAQTSGSPWSLDWYYTPQYFDFIYSSQAEVATQNLSQDLYQSAYSYAIGVAVDCRLNERWALNAGLAFQNTQESFTNNDLRFGSQHDGSGGYDPSTPAEYASVQFNNFYYQLEVPLSVKYYIVPNGVRFYGRVGIQPEWWIGDKRVVATVTTDAVTEIDQDQSIPFNTNLRKFNIAALVGFGAAFRLHRRLDLFVEPEGKFSTLTFTKDTPIRSRKYLLGLRTGLSLRFAEGN